MKYKSIDNANIISRFAVKAMLYEVSCTPKPGLVDRKDSGSHSNMNYFTFIDSTLSLSSTFYRLVLTGMKTDESGRELFLKIKKIGRNAEKEMFAATNGINTQKGLIFSIGIICVAVGVTLKNNDNLKFKLMRKEIINLTEGIVEKELKCIKARDDIESLTHGQKMFLKYGATGIRGEVESGFKTVFSYGLPSLKYYQSQGYNINDSLVNTLLNLMTVTEDTNVLFRAGKEGLKIVKEEAKKVLKAGGIKTKEGKKIIEEMNNMFKEKNISPGGSADLLAISLFLYFIEREFNN